MIYSETAVDHENAQNRVSDGSIGENKMSDSEPATSAT